MKKKGDLQFQAYQSGDEYHGLALNTAGSPVAHVTISSEPEYNEYDEDSWTGEGIDKVSWAMANKEGRTRAGPHMLLAMMSKHYDLDPVADADLSHAGAMMSRSAARRGLIQGHPANPDMRTNIGHIGETEEAANWSMRAAHHDAVADDAHRIKWGEESRIHHFDTGARREAKETLFPKRKQKEDPQGRLF